MTDGEIQPALGETLRTERRRRSMSLRDLAREIGVSFNALSRIERGNAPGLANYQRIVAWLGVVHAGVTPVTYWTVRCTQCGGDAFEGNEYTAYPSAKAAAEAAFVFDYTLGTDGRWRCPDCVNGEP